MGASQPSTPVLGDSTSIYVAGREGSLTVPATHVYIHVLMYYLYILRHVPVYTLMPLLLYLVYIAMLSGHTYEPIRPCTYLPECLIPLTQTQRSYWVDNCCSTSITNDLHDFIAPPRPARAKVEGYNGTTTATMVGTVCWKIHDDLGNEHQLLLPNTYYSPEGNKTMPPTLGTDRQR
jgi:hypothetical protein